MRLLDVGLRRKNFRLLWAAHTFSGLGDWAGRLGLATLVYDRSHSAAAAALVVAVSLAAWFGPGQVLATLGDQYSRRTVLVTCDAVRFAAFALMLLPVPSSGLLALAAAAGLAAPPFAAARAALLPDTVPKDEYPAALALTQATEQVTILLGYAIGGVLIAVAGAGTCLVVNALSFAVSAAFIARLDVPRKSSGVRTERRLASAARFVLADRPIMLALALTAATAGCATAAEALIVPLARQFGGGSSTSAAFAIAVPVGTLLATLLVRHKVDIHANMLSACRLAMVGGAAGLVAFSFGDDRVLFGLGLLATGIVFGVAALTNAVIGPRLPSELRASAFGLLLGVLVGTQAIGAAAGGVVAQLVGVRQSCALFLALAVVPAVLCRLACRVVAPTGSEQAVHELVLEAHP